MNELQLATARAIVNVFETGRVQGNYSGIAVAKGDSGHLSYGRSQASLGSGALYDLLSDYCQCPGARYATALTPYLPRFQQKDVTLDTNMLVRQILKDAANLDPLMRATQDRFFDRRYLSPALMAAEALGITDPLSQTVIYDSTVQGGWARLRGRLAAPVTGKTRDWVRQYVDVRRAWLMSLAAPLPSTVYRMDTFKSLMVADKWDLDLPLIAHGVTLTEESLAADVPVSNAKPRALILTSPYLRGADVEAAQRSLVAKGLPATMDGVYGPFTDGLVKRWQTSQAIPENGVGPLTRASLGL